MVTPTCSGRLIVTPRSGLFYFGSLCWLSGLGLDCLIFLGLAFRVVLLDSWAALGLGSLWVCWPMFSGWNGLASGFSGLCPHRGLVVSVARSPGSSSPVGLGFVDSWDVGWISNPLIVVVLSEVRLFGLRSILRMMMGMSVRHDWSHSQSGDMHFTDLASTLVMFPGSSIVM